MREIKFRGKRVDNGEWVYGLPSLNARHYAIRWLDNGTFRSPSVDRKTVGQFTGLKDNTKWEQLTENEQSAWLNSGKTKEQWDGKEIYEGDIINLKPWLRSTDLRPAKVVCKNLGHITLIAADNGTEYGTVHMGEVIGNIYDNPELVEVQNA